MSQDASTSDELMPRTQKEAWWMVSSCLGEAIDALAFALTVFPQSSATADEYHRMDRCSQALVELLDQNKRRLDEKEQG